MEVRGREVIFHVVLPSHESGGGGVSFFQQLRRNVGVGVGLRLVVGVVNGREDGDGQRGSDGGEGDSSSGRRRSVLMEVVVVLMVVMMMMLVVVVVVFHRSIHISGSSSSSSTRHQ